MELGPINNDNEDYKGKIKGEKCMHGVKRKQRLLAPNDTSNAGPITVFLGKPVMRTHWKAGTAPHKSGRCRDESMSDKQRCL